MDLRTQRLAALDRQIARLDRRMVEMRARSDQFVRWRVMAFIGTLVAAFVGFNVTDALGYAALLIGLVVFILLARQHGQIKHANERLKTWQALKRETVARMTLSWRDLPPSAFAPAFDHPFAADIDLTGDYSLHRMLDTSISWGGAGRLRDWLLATEPDADAIARRQRQVNALRPLATFRDKLRLHARLSDHTGGRWDGERLRVWLNADQTPSVPRTRLIALWGLAAANITLILLNAAGVLPSLWLATFALYAGLFAWSWRSIGDLFGDALKLRSELARLQAVLGFLQTTPHGNRPVVVDLCAPFRDPTDLPSARLRRVGRLVTAASLQRNPIVWFFLNLTIPWDVQVAYLLEHSKRQLRDALPAWLDAVYELETLMALAAFAWREPSFTMPVIRDEAQTFTGRGFGHPLIPTESRVCNDFAFAEPGQVVMITGSNMSGKSSFLRTLGLNLVLSYAGSVVAADDMETSLFRLHSSIRVTDSVVDGISFFYAEVKRLRGLLDALHRTDTYPLFFLIDEIFRGTNNRERLIGSRSYIRALVGGHGVGLVSTHDLELVKLADELPNIINYHFREDVRDGRMAFDYQLRSGPSPTTNALTIMRLEGLPVEDGVD